MSSVVGAEDLAQMRWRRAGIMPRAEDEFRDLLPHLERRLGPDHPDTLAAAVTGSITCEGGRATGLLSRAEGYRRGQLADGRGPLSWINWAGTRQS